MTVRRRFVLDGHCPVHGWMPEGAHGPAWVRRHADCGAHLDKWGWEPPRDGDIDEIVDAFVEWEKERRR